MSSQQNPSPRHPIEVMTELIPEAVALRLGEAAWRATLAALNREKNEATDKA